MNWQNSYHKMRRLNPSRREIDARYEASKAHMKWECVKVQRPLFGDPLYLIYNQKKSIIFQISADKMPSPVKKSCKRTGKAYWWGAAQGTNFVFHDQALDKDW